jgi:hypothetical protein
MADLAQVLATYDALVGVAVGAGLTYGFSALNRRHVEKREDATRWYHVRLQAYAELSKAVFTDYRLARKGRLTDEIRKEVISAMESAGGMTRLVGSAEVLEACALLMETSTALRDPDSERSQFIEAFTKFEAAARKDLGHPPLS